MVINEKTVLSVVCPDCFARPKRQCFGHRGEILKKAHPARFKYAQELLTDRLAGKLNATDKALVLYYAYIMLCDSVSANSQAVLGIVMDTEQIQAGFARKAIQALQEDGLLPVPEKANNGKSN
jgi:hypothetical protein